MQARFKRYNPPSWPAVTITAVVALVVAAVLALANPMQLRIDGQPVLSDVPPVSSNSTVFVSLRSVGEALGAETKYEPKTGEITVLRGDQILRLVIGQTKATLNGMPMTLKHAPFRVRGRVMVSLRTVQRAFGVNVKVDKKHTRIDVRTPGMAQNTETEAP